MERSATPPPWPDLFDALPSGVLVVDATGRFVQANAEARRLLGLCRTGVLEGSLDAPAWTIVWPGRGSLPGEAHPGARTLRGGGPEHRVPAGILKAPGEAQWFEWSSAPLPDGGVLLTLEAIAAPPGAARPPGEAFFRDLLVRQGEGFAVVDLDERFVFANPVAEDIFGVARGSLAGHSLVEFLDEDQRVVVADQTRRRVAGESGTYELCIRRAGGELRTLQVTVTPRPALDGGPFTVIGVFRDITDLKQAQDALRESEAKFRRLMESVDQVALILDLQGRVTFCNDHLLRLTGWRREEVLGQDWFLRFVPERLVEVRQRFLAHFAGNSVPVHFDNPILTRSGEERLIHWTNTIITDPHGEAVGAASLGEDITERDHAEAALRASEDKFSKAFHASPDSVNINRLSDGVYVAVNDGFTRITGYTAAEVVGRSSLPGDLGLWVHGEDRARLQEGLRRDGLVPGLEALFRRKDGTVLTGLMSASLIEVGGEPCVLSITRDITERKRAEEERAKLQAQLLQAQKMQSLGSLAGGVAHDMNNVLGAILALASANLEHQDPGSPVHRAFDTIAQAAVRGGRMVKSLLSFARQDPAEARILDLNELLREQVRLLERTTLAKVRLELDLAPDLSPVVGDGGALAHALMNLCVNAVDAMGEGGTLILRTRDAGGWVEVAVEDSGCGMTEEVQARALDPFFTTKPVGKGTGLGLSMVYSTVQAHQGRMELRSDPGLGTCVTLSFPAGAQGAVPEESGPALPAPAPRTLDVLVVDDDELIQGALEALLDALGHRTLRALSGEQALLAVGGGFRPDVILLDMNMPGLGGAGTLPRLRALLPSVPILLATGRADQGALDLVAAHPGVTLLPKPFTLGDLQRLFQRVATGW